MYIHEDQKSKYIYVNTKNRLLYWKREFRKIHVLGPGLMSIRNKIVGNRGSHSISVRQKFVNIRENRVGLFDYYGMNT